MTGLLLVALAFGDEPRRVISHGRTYWRLDAPANESLTYTVALPSGDYVCRGYASGSGVQQEKLESMVWADVHRCLHSAGEAKGLAGEALENWITGLLYVERCTLTEVKVPYFGADGLLPFAREQTYIC